MATLNKGLFLTLPWNSKRFLYTSIKLIPIGTSRIFEMTSTFTWLDHPQRAECDTWSHLARRTTIGPQQRVIRDSEFRPSPQRQPIPRQDAYLRRRFQRPEDLPWQGAFITPLEISCREDMSGEDESVRNSTTFVRRLHDHHRQHRQCYIQHIRFSLPFLTIANSSPYPLRTEMTNISTQIRSC